MLTSGKLSVCTANGSVSTTSVHYSQLLQAKNPLQACQPKQIKTTFNSKLLHCNTKVDGALMMSFQRPKVAVFVINTTSFKAAINNNYYKKDIDS